MKRLYNQKTKKETGFEHILLNLNTMTPYGKKALAKMKYFFSGEEKELREELENVELLVNFIHNEKKAIESVKEIFLHLKDILFSITRANTNTLSVVEIYEVKSFLLLLEKLFALINENKKYFKNEWQLWDSMELLDFIDPHKERIDTFYIYDEFSEKLAAYRKEKHDSEKQVRAELKKIKAEVEKKYKIGITPKFEFTVSKADKTSLSTAENAEELVRDGGDYLTVTFKLKSSEQIHKIKDRIEKLNEKIDEQELLVREKISERIGIFSKKLTENCLKIGKIDLTMAKAFHGVKNNCNKPVIIDEFRYDVKNARHLKVEEILTEKHKVYCPVSYDLGIGVNCITGANMGGKTVSLKLVGLVAMMAQHGMFVPSEKATLGLSAYMHILIGDNQSMERGLSSFGGEMEELKEIFDNAVSRSLILIDEIAAGTNPSEGAALTTAIIEYLHNNEYISVVTTHYDIKKIDEKMKILQVKGLSGADFKKLEKEIKNASRKERINIIAKYMDYKLSEQKSQTQIPKDAINIAQMLGIYPKIIESAKKKMEKSNYN